MNPVTVLLILLSVISYAYGEVWVGNDGSLNRYRDDGTVIKEYTKYRMPTALTVDRTRNRLWFVDQYDYTLICLDAATGEEIYNLKNLVSAPGTTATSTDYFYSEGLEPAPAMTVYEADGSLWIADLYAHQVVKVDANGKEVLRKSGFRAPAVIAVEQDTGDVWVNSGNASVFKLDGNAETLFKYSGLDYPLAIVVDPAADVVWIADYGNHLIRGLGLDGNLLYNVVTDEPPVGMFINDDQSYWVILEYDTAQLISKTGEILMSYDDLGKPFQVEGNGIGAVWVLDRGSDEAVYLDGECKKCGKIGDLVQALSLAVF